MPENETYGGKCPVCSKSMLQKGGKVGTWFSFDACPWCGFAYGEVDNMEVTSAGVWNSVLEHYDAKNRQELIEKLSLPEQVSEKESDFYPSIFSYSEEAMEHIKQINDLKVFLYYDDTEHHGKCDCDQCDAQGITHRVGIYEFECECEGNDPECEHDDLLDTPAEPIEACYAKTVAEAYKAAEAFCNRYGYPIVFRR